MNLTANSTSLRYSMDNTSILQTLEEYEYQQFLDEDLLVVSYLVLLSVVGTIGNGHALIVYYLRYKVSNHRTFVLWLSVVDLLACCLGIPFEIADLRYSYTFYAVAPCKIFRFLNHFVSVGSGLLLGVIALERYRKVCMPFKQQMDEKCAMKACIITVVFALLLSIPGFVFYGPSKKLTETNLTGSDCTVLASYKNGTVFWVYSGLFLLISTIIFIICVVAYVLVGRAMYKQMVFRKSAQITGKKPATVQRSNSRTLSRSTSHENGAYIADEESSMNVLDMRNKISTIDRKVAKGNNQKTKKFVLDRSKRITLMFLVATAVSYVGYLPYNIIIFIKVLNPKAYRGMSDVLGQFMSVLLRGYFLNNASNPVVYCFLDNRFRTECKNFYAKIHEYVCKRREKKGSII